MEGDAKNGEHADVQPTRARSHIAHRQWQASRPEICLASPFVESSQPESATQEERTVYVRSSCELRLVPPSDTHEEST